MKVIVNKIPNEPGQQPASSYSFVFVLEDGSTLLSSSRYKSKDSAYKGVRAVQKNCNNSKRYAITTSPNGRLSFDIKSGNGLAIARSMNFTSEKEMQEVVNYIQNTLPDCEIDFQKKSF